MARGNCHARHFAHRKTKAKSKIGAQTASKMPHVAVSSGGFSPCAVSFIEFTVLSSKQDQFLQPGFHVGTSASRIMLRFHLNSVDARTRASRRKTFDACACVLVKTRPLGRRQPHDDCDIFIRVFFNISVLHARGTLLLPRSTNELFLTQGYSFCNV